MKREKRTGAFMSDALRRVKIRYRLLCVFLLLSLLPVTFMGAFAYRTYSRSIHEKLRQSTEQAVELLNQDFITEIDKFRSYIDTISIARDLQDMLSVPPGANFVATREMVMKIDELKLQVPFQSTYLKNMRVLDRDKNIIYDLGYDDITPDRFATVMDRIDEASPKDSLQYVRTYRSMDKIILGRKIHKCDGSGEVIGYILIYIDEKLISDILFANVSFGDGSNILLMDADGNIISSQDKALLGSAQADDAVFAQILNGGGTCSFNAELGGIQQMVISNYNSALELYMIATIPYKYITSETSQINASIGIVASCLMLLSLVATMIVYSSIMRPINRMTAMCSITTDADLDKEIGDLSADELGFLSRSIDNMFREMKELGVRWNNDQMMKRQLELEMLQYQVNPHFLFNTLSGLKFLAQMNDVPVLEESIASLSSLLRHTLVKKQELIPLRLEVENLDHYFTLQKIRYAGMFEVCRQLDPDTLAYEIPRFVLQPLAENSIIHGTLPDRCITIIVESRFVGDGEIEIVLRDDGSGFDTSDAVVEKEHFSGIGLSNVDQRIKLHYGTHYGLVVTSSPGSGTACRILIPKRLCKEETDDVSGTAR